MKKPLAFAAALLAGTWSLALSAQETTGTLVFDVKPFTSNVKLKEKIENRLKTGGIEWGIADGQLVVTLVNKRFIAFEIPNMTRYGESKTLQVPAGSYKLHCIGFVPEGGFSVEKALSKGAWFNLDLTTFEIPAGKTVTIEVYPTMDSESTFFLKFYLPQLKLRIVADGQSSGDLIINHRGLAAIAWDDYNGPLKFKTPVN